MPISNMHALGLGQARNLARTGVHLKSDKRAVELVSCIVPKHPLFKSLVQPLTGRTQPHTMRLLPLVMLLTKSTRLGRVDGSPVRTRICGR